MWIFYRAFFSRKRSPLLLYNGIIIYESRNGVVQMRSICRDYVSLSRETAMLCTLVQL